MKTVSYFVRTIIVESQENKKSVYVLIIITSQNPFQFLALDNFTEYDSLIVPNHMTCMKTLSDAIFEALKEQSEELWKILLPEKFR